MSSPSLLDVDPRPQVDLLGLALDPMDEPQVIDTILGELDRGRGGWLLNPNIDVLRKITLDPELARLAATARLVVADGMPLVWASALQGERLPAVVPGSTMIWNLSRAAADAGRRVFLLGGAPGVGERAAERLGREVPSLSVAGWHCPPLGFEHRAADGEAIRAALSAARPDIVFTALGFPKQERLMAALSQELSTTWFIGSGASLAFVAGDLRRAPRWMQRSGLEWAHRLGSEPRRLFRRYVIEDVPFAGRLLARSARRRLTARSA